MSKSADPLPPTALRLHRVLKAPRALIWRCWTEPDLIMPWFVPKPHSVTEAVVELRPGGRFFTRMLVDGTAYPNDGSILHVDPGRELVFTDLLLSDWRPVAEPGLGFSASILLADHPEGTDYTAIARHPTRDIAEKHEAMGFSEGWGIAADQLEAFAQGLMKAGKG